MRIYQVKTETNKLIVAAHNKHQAQQVSGFKKVVSVEEINIYEPVIIWQESTQMAKSVSTSVK